MSNEQWKTDGDCSKCRKKAYCSKTCKANEKALRKYVSSLVRKKMNEVWNE